MKPEEWKIGSSWIWPAEGELVSHDVLARFHEANVSCVETGVIWEWDAPKYDDHSERLKSIIGRFQDSNIEVWSIHVPGGRTIDISHSEYAEAGIKLVGRNMEVCAQMGVDKIVLHPSYEPITNEDRPARIARCQKSLKMLYRPDVKIAVETLPRTCLCNDVNETHALISSLKDIAYCCVDVNHCHRGNIVDMLRTMQEQLITLHISDDDGKDEKHWYPTEGVLNWNDILGTLDEIGYNGCFMYELKDKYEDPFMIRRNFDHLVELYKASKH